MKIVTVSIVCFFASLFYSPNAEAAKSYSRSRISGRTTHVRGYTRGYTRSYTRSGNYVRSNYRYTPVRGYSRR